MRVHVDISSCTPLPYMCRRGEGLWWCVRVHGWEVKCMYTYKCTCLASFAPVHVYHIYVCLCVYVFVFLYVCVAHLYVRIRVCMYDRLIVHMCVRRG